jgi:hypothetical protein
MKARIRILRVALVGTMGVGMFHLFTVLDHQTRLLTFRVFEIVYRLYSFPI